MLSLFRSRSLLLVPVLVLLLAARAPAQSQAVSFDTGDGVKIKGSYWPSAKGGRNAPVVLLLHDFDQTKGGTSHDNGWDSLGDALQKKGYAVLSFDFRGHGASTTVKPEVFFNQPTPLNQPAFPQNRTLKTFNMTKPPVTISHKDFNPLYYPYLVNDIAAAKTYLDIRSDNGDHNSANLILIGAGEGATLGNMWLTAEQHRFVAKPIPGAINRWDLSSTDAEGGDVVCAMWLSLSPTLADHPYRGGAGLRAWIGEYGRQAKIPVVFIYGQQDKNGDAIALAGLEAAVPSFKRGPNNPREKGYEFSGELAVPGTKLTGSKLLAAELDTERWIVDEYLKVFTDKQINARPWRKHNAEDNFYVWKWGGQILPAKVEGDKMIKSPPLRSGLLAATVNGLP